MNLSSNPSSKDAHREVVVASFTIENKVSRCRTILPTNFLRFLSFAAILAFVGGCGSSPAPPSAPQAEAKPAQPAIPEDIQAAANALLGSETTVLAFGDLAKNGKQQVLAANVLPKTPQNTIPGTVVSRAVIAEKNDNNWHELIRCDDYLKNEKGYMGLTPLTRISAWRLQFEQDTEKGLQVYFTPVKGNTDLHVLPIGVRWNPETKRYQSLDRTYEHFLGEASSLGAARSYLK